MEENIKYGILSGMYKLYQNKYPKDDSYINHFSFPHLILMQEHLSSFLNISTSESVIKLRELVKGGYLKEDRVKFYLTEKALKYLVDRSKTIEPVQPDTKHNPNWQNNIVTYLVVGVVIMITGTIIIKQIYPS